MKQFQKRFYGKWVLSGEYSVLRSGSALVYPIPHYYIDFSYSDSKTALQIKRRGPHQVGLDFSVAPLLDKALKKANKKREQLKGTLTIESFIPFGTGLGASAVICTGLASLFLYKGWISKSQLKDFAISLENFFHGQSSGMDISSVLEQKAVLYQNGKVIQNLPKFKVKPLLFLSYSGGRAPTSVGVSKVNKLFDTNKNKAKKIDKDMSVSTSLCLQALKEKNKNKCNQILQQALSLGRECFQSWKLISYDLENHMNHLEQKGALAEKPTGSGLGGHVISLWDKKPPTSLKKHLIKLDL